SLHVGKGNAGSYQSACPAAKDRRYTCRRRWFCPPNQPGQWVYRLLRIRSFGCRSSLLLGLNCGMDRLVHLVVAGTATEISAEGMPDLVFAGIRILVEQRFHGHDEPRRTVPALRSAPVSISLLNCS